MSAADRLERSWWCLGTPAAFGAGSLPRGPLGERETRPLRRGGGGGFSLSSQALARRMQRGCVVAHLRTEASGAPSSPGMTHKPRLSCCPLYALAADEGGGKGSGLLGRSADSAVRRVWCVPLGSPSTPRPAMLPRDALAYYADSTKGGRRSPARVERAAFPRTTVAVDGPPPPPTTPARLSFPLFFLSPSPVPLPPPSFHV